METVQASPGRQGYVMGEKTEISWTDSSWNPWYGCHKVSPGCKNCYMYRDMQRTPFDPHTPTRAANATFRKPLRWKEPRRVFTCSWSDWFVEEADQWRDEAWDIVRQTPHLTYQILTKRPERIADHLPPVWPLDNVWLGVSAEDQERADERIPMLLDIPAAVHFVSAEPLLAPIDLSAYMWPTHWHWDGAYETPEEAKAAGAFAQKEPQALVSAYRMFVQWVITGGESGPDCRPMDLEWVRFLRDQCSESVSAFFHKQHGGQRKIDGAYGGRELDGVIHHGFPDG